jgi:hypothetical protein
MMVTRATQDDQVLRDLHATLDRRWRPEDVARLILDGFAGLYAVDEQRVIGTAARGALRHHAIPFTSMAQDFARPVGFASQLTVAHQLFVTVSPVPAEAAADPETIHGFLAAAGHTIGKAVGANDFKADRLNRDRREAIGLDISKRQYNKRFRLLARMERKRGRLLRELQKRFFTLVGKSRLASQLPWEEFASDLSSACFVAYYTAQCNLRSEFTISGQQRPFDEIAATLLARCKHSQTTNWWAIAHAFPDREVLANLSDEQKGLLLARWFGVLEGVAGLLREVWEANRFERTTMIVRRGNDSSTWNNTAGAWNKARESWIALLHAMDADAILDSMCPGKVLRLMAADVVAWHRGTGGGLDPDTAVWAELPFPWEVLSGAAPCSREHVEAVCKRHKVDPEKKGWTAPRPGRTVAAFRPTPELVHGVTVGNAGLALLLRKAGFFSGKALKLPSNG